MSKLNEILSLLKAVVEEEAIAQNQNNEILRRIRTLKNGTLSLLLRENVKYSVNGNNFQIRALGKNQMVSKTYASRYLGDDAIKGILSRNQEKAIDANSVKNIPAMDLDKRTDEKSISRNLSKLEAKLSSLYGDIITEGANLNLIEDNKKLKKLKEENETLKKENTDLKEELALANDTIEMLRAENDRFKIIMFRLRSDDLFQGDEPDTAIEPDDITESDLDEYEVDDDDDVSGMGEIEEEIEEEISPKKEIDDANVDKMLEDVDMGDAVYGGEGGIKEEEKEKIPETQIGYDELLENSWDLALGNEDTKEEIQDVPEEKIEEVVEAEPEKEEEVEPEEEIDDDVFQLYRGDFTFDYEQVLLEENGEAIDGAELIISPLSLEEKFPRLLIWTKHKSKTRVMTAQNNKNVAINFNDFKLSLAAKMLDGKFTTSIRLIDQKDNQSIQNMPTIQNGAGGHLCLNYLTDDNEKAKIHIMPVMFKNDVEDGFANFAFCVEKNGEIIQCGDSKHNGGVINNGDHPLRVIAKWNAAKELIAALTEA